MRDAAGPDALALVRNALGDPDEAVRRSYDGERDALVAAVAEHDPDPARRQIALHVLVAASRSYLAA